MFCRRWRMLLVKARFKLIDLPRPRRFVANTYYRSGRSDRLEDRSPSKRAAYCRTNAWRQATSAPSSFCLFPFFLLSRRLPVLTMSLAGLYAPQGYIIPPSLASQTQKREWTRCNIILRGGTTISLSRAQVAQFPESLFAKLAPSGPIDVPVSGIPPLIKEAVAVIEIDRASYTAGIVTDYFDGYPVFPLSAHQVLLTGLGLAQLLRYLEKDAEFYGLPELASGASAQLASIGYESGALDQAGGAAVPGRLPGGERAHEIHLMQMKYGHEFDMAKLQAGPEEKAHGRTLGLAQPYLLELFKAYSQGKLVRRRKPANNRNRLIHVAREFSS